MFYQQTIRELRAANELLSKSWEKKAAELVVVQEAYQKLLLQKFDLEARNKQLVDALNIAKEVNNDIEAENDDLVRKLDLLEQVLKQLQIPVKLPTRKK